MTVEFLVKILTLNTWCFALRIATLNLLATWWWCWRWQWWWCWWGRWWWWWWWLISKVASHKLPAVTFNVDQFFPCYQHNCLMSIIDHLLHQTKNNSRKMQTQIQLLMLIQIQLQIHKGNMNKTQAVIQIHGSGAKWKMTILWKLISPGPSWVSLHNISIRGVWATIQLKCLLGTATIMNGGGRAGVSPLFGFLQNQKQIFRKVDLFNETYKDNVCTSWNLR